jgi:hypothetical protein
MRNDLEIEEAVPKKIYEHIGVATTQLAITIATPDDRQFGVTTSVNGYRTAETPQSHGNTKRIFRHPSIPLREYILIAASPGIRVTSGSMTQTLRRSAPVMVVEGGLRKRRQFVGLAPHACRCCDT